MSARDLFQLSYPNDPIKWKIECFRQQIGLHINEYQDMKNFMVVSIGDGLFERIAVKTICDEFKINSCSLKLFELPNPTVLCNQIDLIIQCFAELLEIPRDLFIDDEDENSEKYSCNDLYFDYNADGYLCIFHWEKKELDKLPCPDAINLSCTECLQNSQLQDMIVKNMHHDQLESSCPDDAVTKRSTSIPVALTPSIDREVDLSNSFISIAVVEDPSFVLDDRRTPECVVDGPTETMTPLLSSTIHCGQLEKEVESGLSEKKTLSYFEDCGSTSGESNVEEDDCCSLAGGLGSAGGEAVRRSRHTPHHSVSFYSEFSFRSDGNQSRNSDASELSDLSVTGTTLSPLMAEQFPSSLSSSSFPLIKTPLRRSVSVDELGRVPSMSDKLGQMAGGRFERAYSTEEGRYEQLVVETQDLHINIGFDLDEDVPADFPQQQQRS